MSAPPSARDAEYRQRGLFRRVQKRLGDMHVPVEYPAGLSCLAKLQHLVGHIEARAPAMVGGADYVVRSMGDVSYFAAERQRIQQEG